MGLTSGFFNSINGDRRYTAEELGSIFEGIITEGVFPNIGECFKVVPSETEGFVTVKSGRAWFNNIWVNLDEDMDVEIGPQSDKYTWRLIYLKVDKRVANRSTTLGYEIRSNGNTESVVLKTKPTPHIETLYNGECMTIPLALLYLKANDLTVYEIDNLVGDVVPFIKSLNPDLSELDNMKSIFEYMIEGYDIKMEDTTNNPLNGFKIDGRSSNQIVTQGYQLFDMTGSAFEDIIDEYGYVHPNKTSDDRAWGYANSDVFVTLPAGTYTLSTEILKMNTVGTRKIILYSDSDGWLAVLENDVTTFTFGVAETTNLGLFAKLYDSVERFTLVSGSTAKPWEPYSYGYPTPSPNCPQEINVAGWVCKGKQLLDVGDPIEQTINGVKFTVNEDGTVLVNGTASAEISYIIISGSTFGILPIGKYFLSGCPESGSSTSYYLRCGGGYHLQYDDGNGVILEGDGIKLFGLVIYITQGTVCNNILFRPMLQHASTAPGWKPAPFEPFGSGVNLLENTATTQTINGVTFTVNADKSVTVNGTASSTAILYLNLDLETKLKIGEKYYLSGSPQNGAELTYNLRLYTASGYANIQDVGNGVYFNNTGITKVGICINADQTVSNLVFRPMLTLADFADFPYSPYMEDGGNVAKFNCVEERVEGAQLLDVGDPREQTINGVKFTVNEDGIVLANGTATQNIYFNLGDINVSAGKYFYNGCPNIGSNNIFLEFKDTSTNNWYFDYGEGVLVDFPSDTTLTTVFIGIKSGQTVNNLIFKPMLQKASTDPNWKPKPFMPYVAPQTLIIPTPTGLPSIPLPDTATEYTYIGEDGKKYLADSWMYDGEKCWRMKRVGKLILQAGTYSLTAEANGRKYFDVSQVNNAYYSENVASVISTAFKSASVNDRLTDTTNIITYIQQPSSDNIRMIASFPQGYVGNSVDMAETEFYYILKNSIKTELTNPALIEQVKALCTNTGYTEIVASDYNGMIVHQNVEYYKDNRTIVEKKADTVELEKRVENLEQYNPSSMVYLGKLTTSSELKVPNNIEMLMIEIYSNTVGATPVITDTIYANREDLLSGAYTLTGYATNASFISQVAMSLYLNNDGILSIVQTSKYYTWSFEHAKVYGVKPSTLDKGIHYSTEEQVVGTWIDGKSIYQKTVIIPITEFTNQSGTNYYTFNLVSVFGDFNYVDHQIVYKNSEKGQLPPSAPFSGNSLQNYVYGNFVDRLLYIVKGSSIGEPPTDTIYYFTMWYTLNEN